MKLVITESKKFEMVNSLVTIRDIIVESGAVSAEKVDDVIYLGSNETKKFIGGEMNFRGTSDLKTLEVEVSEETFAFAVKAAHKAAKILRPIISMAKAMGEVIVNVRKDLTETWNEMTRAYKEDHGYRYDTHVFNLSNVGARGAIVTSVDRFGQRCHVGTYYAEASNMITHDIAMYHAENRIPVYVGTKAEAEAEAEKILLRFSTGTAEEDDAAGAAEEETHSIDSIDDRNKAIDDMRNFIFDDDLVKIVIKETAACGSNATMRAGLIGKTRNQIIEFDIPKADHEEIMDAFKEIFTYSRNHYINGWDNSWYYLESTSLIDASRLWDTFTYEITAHSSRIEVVSE